MSRTIWWEDNQVKMIDQRILPLHYEILSYNDYRDVAEAITDMEVRGTRQSARRAATAWCWQRSKTPPATATASWAIWQSHKQCWMRLGPPRST